jgi:hypothetical protein
MPWPFADIAEPDYDSDFADVPAVLTALTTSEVRLVGANIANTAGFERTITVTDTAGKVLITAIFPAGQTLPPLEWAFMKTTGIKWQADDVGVVAKLWGYTV